MAPTHVPQLLIRPATSADAEAIAQLHAASWRSAYRGIMPDSCLDGPLLETKLDHWRSLLAGGDRDRQVVLLGEAEGQMRGFVAGRLDPDGGPDGLIDNLHVWPDGRGQGFGRALLIAAASSLAAAGCRGLFLWVFDGNRPALDFYARMGGEVTETGWDEIDGARLPHRRYSWADIEALVPPAPSFSWSDRAIRVDGAEADSDQENRGTVDGRNGGR